MVPLSKVGHVKCSECSLVAHEHCSGRIPDLCGLPDGFLDQMRSFSAEKINSGKSNDVAPADTTPVPPVSTAPKRLGSFGNLLSLSSSNLHSSGLSTSHHNALLNSKPYGSQSKLNPKKQGIFDDGKGQSQAGVPTLAPLATSQPSVAPSTMSAPVPQKKRDESLTFFKNGSRGVGLDDFTFLAVLGKGNFGKVMLAQEKFTNLYFAIKVLKKEFILEHDEVDRYLFLLLFFNYFLRQYQSRETSLSKSLSRKSPLSCQFAFMLSNRVPIIFCHGIHIWRGSHVAYPTQEIYLEPSSFLCV